MMSDVWTRLLALICAALLPATMSADDILPAPPAPPSNTARADSASDNELRSLEKLLDAQTVVVSSYDPAEQRVELLGHVTSADSLSRIRDELLADPRVRDVRSTQIAIAGSSPRPAPAALQELLSHLQDGKAYDRVITQAHLLMASDDPELRSAGLIFSAVGYSATGRHDRMIASLRLLARVNPRLLDEANLRDFMVNSPLRTMAGFTTDLWSADIINPYFVSTRPLPRFLAQHPSTDALDQAALARRAGPHTHLVGWRGAHPHLLQTDADTTDPLSETPPAGRPAWAHATAWNVYTVDGYTAVAPASPRPAGAAPLWGGYAYYYPRATFGYAPYWGYTYPTYTYNSAYWPGWAWTYPVYTPPSYWTGPYARGWYWGPWHGWYPLASSPISFYNPGYALWAPGYATYAYASYGTACPYVTGWTYGYGSWPYVYHTPGDYYWWPYGYTTWVNVNPVLDTSWYQRDALYFASQATAGVSGWGPFHFLHGHF